MKSSGVCLYHLEKTKNDFIDFQNDVAVSDVELAIREGFRSIEHVKRYTTLGMAGDQGKTSNLNGLQYVSKIEKKNCSRSWSYYI